MCPPGFTGTRCEQGKERIVLGPGQERQPGWGKTDRGAGACRVNVPNRFGTLGPNRGPSTHMLSF